MLIPFLDTGRSHDTYNCNHGSSAIDTVPETAGAHIDDNNALYGSIDDLSGT